MAFRRGSSAIHEVGSGAGGTGRGARVPPYNVGRAGLAQMVEQLICNQLVGGSIPLPGTISGAHRPAGGNEKSLAVVWKLDHSRRRRREVMPGTPRQSGVFGIFVMPMWRAAGAGSHLAAEVRKACPLVEAQFDTNRGRFPGGNRHASHAGFPTLVQLRCLATQRVILQGVIGCPARRRRSDRNSSPPRHPLRGRAPLIGRKVAANSRSTAPCRIAGVPSPRRGEGQGEGKCESNDRGAA